MSRRPPRYRLYLVVQSQGIVGVVPAAMTAAVTAAVGAAVGALAVLGAGPAAVWAMATAAFAVIA